MGCGASSLKGEEVNLNAPTPTSAPGTAPRRVNTNFASVDYSQETNQGRRMTEYAPHETVKAKKSHDAGPGRTSSGSARPEDSVGSSGAPGLMGVNGDSIAATGYPHDGVGPRVGTAATENVELKPYMTNGDDNWDNDRSNDTNHHEPPSQINGTQAPADDPTSATAKTQFANENDPASIANQRSHHTKQSSVDPTDPSTGNAPQERKKSSWLGDKYSKYQSFKHSKDVSISDEDLKKYTGKDRKELNDWAAGRDGVGGNQAAGRVGVDNARGPGQPWSLG